MYTEVAAGQPNVEPLPDWMTVDTWNKAIKGYRNHISTSDYFDVLNNAREISGNEKDDFVPPIPKSPDNSDKSKELEKEEFKKTLSAYSRGELMGMYKNMFDEKADRNMTVPELIEVIVEGKFRK